MSTHLHIATDKEGDRKLSEPCDFCDAVIGEPCRIHYSEAKYHGKYICPDKRCERLYQTPQEALGCAHSKQSCFDCGKELNATNISKDTVEGRPLCSECATRRWQVFIADPNNERSA